jgi:CRISPR-associated endonuclease/helicase Cas3
MSQRTDEPKVFLAHSANEKGKRHELGAHLNGVAQKARAFMQDFAVESHAYLAGILHDLGKYSDDFQKRVLRNPEAPAVVEHSAAGAAIAANKRAYEIALAIAGHHGGLPSPVELKERLRRERQAESLAKTSQLQIDTSFLASSGLTRERDMRSIEMHVRMLFSSLVDADFLDTEAHFNPERMVAREHARPEPEHLLSLLEEAVARKRREGKVNAIRREVFAACLKAASLPQGCFSLTVPTGGGKTLSSMAFALKHSAIHGLERIIVVIPYLSIIEQNASEYRRIFGSDCLLEHHSAIEPEKNEKKTFWSRLAAENWDAPIVVTTSVQFFDSLFANRPSTCRKIHNIARSVVVFDEVQTLPSHYLEPILSVLGELIKSYRVSVLFCTATQPAFKKESHLPCGFDKINEIIPNPAPLFEDLKRTRVEWPCSREATMSWENLAQEMRRSKKALAIVNIRKHARILYKLLGPDAFHLSSWMCAQHRLDQLKKIRHGLQNSDTCLVVSTQVVEAGVDLDFSRVFRAMGPLDGIAQAAGRCNREGRLTSAAGDPLLGEVTVFCPKEERYPGSFYALATENVRILMRDRGTIDLNDPAVYTEYFARLYSQVNLDEKRIQELRHCLNFPEVADRFKLIDQSRYPVVVPYSDDAVQIAEQVERAGHIIREQSRALQRHIVDLYPQELDQAKQGGLVRPIIPDLWLWIGDYDPKLGIIFDEPDIAEFVV